MRVRITTREIGLMAELVRELTGIHLDANKAYLFEYRLSPLLEMLGLTDYESLYERVRAEGGSLREQLISAITTDETSFFRDAETYTCLTERILPELIAAKRMLGVARPRVNVWSAACSRGQEPYSLAMIFRERFFPFDEFEIRILATDISQRALDYAARAEYTKYELSRGLTLARLERHFTRRDKTWRVRDELRQLVIFKKLNLLLEEPPIRAFDLLLCRNVAVYFTPEDRLRLFRRLARHLEVGGKLIVGSTETLFELDEFTLKTHGNAQYYERRTEIA